MTQRLTPHVMIFAALACLLVFGIATGRHELGTAIGAAIALSLAPLSILTAIVIGLWFVEYRPFAVGIVVAVIGLETIARFVLAPHPVIAQLGLSDMSAVLLRAAGFVCLAHLINAVRLLFKSSE
jgi:hypothetical protein